MLLKIHSSSSCVTVYLPKEIIVKFLSLRWILLLFLYLSPDTLDPTSLVYWLVEDQPEKDVVLSSCVNQRIKVIATYTS